jgi:hypothetical protein
VATPPAAVAGCLRVRKKERTRRAIVARPTAESDLVAVVHAVQEEWVPAVDPQRFARQIRAASTLPLLRGLSSDPGERRQDSVAEALARRDGMSAPDERQVTGAVLAEVCGASGAVAPMAPEGSALR